MRRFLFPFVLGALLAVGAAAAQAEVVATSTASGVVGALPLGAVGRGRLAGESGVWTYHTYVVEVPAGAATLTITLDADVDLDLFAKPGSEIRSYADRGAGGDWAAADVMTANPTVVTVAGPTPGPWYVDVVNALGAGTFGSYRLVVMVDAGGAAAGRTPAASVPDPCPLLALLPDAPAYGPPAAIRAGTRLVYFGMTASVPGAFEELVPDPTGDWVDEATGERYGAYGVPGAAGAGFSVVQVGHVDAAVAQLVAKLYATDVDGGVSSYAAAFGMVSHAGCASDYWVHPTALRALPDTNQGGVRVLRMPYTIGGRTYDAIRIQTTTASGLTAYVYDLDTGLMLFHGARSQGAEVLAPTFGGQSGAAPGNTQFVSVWLVDVVDVAVPWAGSEPPAWLAGTATVDFQGSVTTFTWTTAPVVQALQVRSTVDARGPSWVHAVTHATVQSLPGMPPEERYGVDASGEASIGGLWIAPAALARLQPGQVVDTMQASLDLGAAMGRQLGATLDVTVTVGAVGGGTVTLVETGPVHRVEFVYDTTSGALIAVTLTQQGTVSRTVTELSRVR